MSCHQYEIMHSRREFLQKTGLGLGAGALAHLLGGCTTSGTAGDPHINGLPGVPHFAPKAKRVIWLSMAGGPSQLETFDPKPKLAEMHGQPMPESFTKGQQLAQLQGQKLTCFGPQHKFAKFGRNQIEICELFPQLGSVIDDVCLIRSMTTDAINHDPAHMFMNTGSQIAGRPSMGAWVTYGLGSEAADLPGFVVLVSTGKGRSPQPIAARQWSSGFLPSRHQGVQLRSKGDPVAVQAFAVDLAKACVLDKCFDVTVTDVRGVSQVCDFIVIASGTSDRQMKSVAQALEDLGKDSSDPKCVAAPPPPPPEGPPPPRELRWRGAFC